MEPRRWLHGRPQTRTTVFDSSTYLHERCTLTDDILEDCHPLAARPAGLGAGQASGMNWQKKVVLLKTFA